MPTIREAGANDRDGWERLWRANCAHFDAFNMGGEVVDALWQRVLDPAHPMSAWLAQADDAPSDIVGLAHTILHPHTFTLRPVCYLEDLWVEPSARGLGIGRSLIEYLEEQGRAQGWRRLYWVTDADNRPAQALYDKIAHRAHFVQYAIDTSS